MTSTSTGGDFKLKKTHWSPTPCTCFEHTLPTKPPKPPTCATLLPVSTGYLRCERARWRSGWQPLPPSRQSFTHIYTGGPCINLHMYVCDWTSNQCSQCVRACASVCVVCNLFRTYWWYAFSWAHIHNNNAAVFWGMYLSQLIQIKKKFKFRFKVKNRSQPYFTRARPERVLMWRQHTKIIIYEVYYKYITCLFLLLEQVLTSIWSK